MGSLVPLSSDFCVQIIVSIFSLSQNYVLHELIMSGRKNIRGDLRSSFLFFCLSVNINNGTCSKSYRKWARSVMSFDSE